MVSKLKTVGKWTLFFIVSGMVGGGLQGVFWGAYRVHVDGTSLGMAVFCGIVATKIGPGRLGVRVILAVFAGLLVVHALGGFR